MLDLTRFKVLTFDCYGTMIDWETGIFSALRPILAAHKKSIADSELLQLYSELEASAEQGEFLRYRDVLQSVVRGFGGGLGLRQPLPKFALYRSRWRTGSRSLIPSKPCENSKAAINSR